MKLQNSITCSKFSTNDESNHLVAPKNHFRSSSTSEHLKLPLLKTSMMINSSQELEENVERSNLQNSLVVNEGMSQGNIRLPLRRSSQGSRSLLMYQDRTPI